jgi:hypothetical protein
METVKKLIGIAVVVGPALLLGCEPQLKENGFKIENVISSVTDASGTINAVLQTGHAPTPNGGPHNTLAGFPAMVNGGSSQQTLSSNAAFNRVVVAVPGAENYYELTLPAGNSAPIILRASNNLPSMNVGVNYAVGNGPLGPYTSQTIKIIHVGTGDVQVSVAWSDSSDVDLHVIDPALEEIYYGHKSSASGGTLDLDSNAACSRDAQGQHKSNENIVWPVGHAPHGTFTVKLAYWSACNVSAPTEYVVTVAVKGQTPQIFTGNFTGPGTGGGAGSGNLITTFTY